MQSLSLTLSKRLSNSNPLFRISSNLVAFASSSSTTTTTATSSPPLNSPPPPISAANGSALSSPTLNNFLTAPWFATQSRGITLSGSDVRVGKIIENQGRVYEKTEDSIQLLRRGFHIEPGTREKALLAEDSALKPFKSYKKSVKKLKRVGDVLTIVVVAGCCYEIYVKAVMREEAREQ